MACVTWRNMPRNMRVTLGPAMGGKRNIRNIYILTPLVYITDVTPQPRELGGEA